MKKRGLVILIQVLLIVFLSDNIQAVMPSNGLVSHWNFEGNANDVIGSNEGTLIGGANILNGVVVLDGVDDRVRVADDNSISGLDKFTVSLWVKSDSKGSTLLAKRAFGKSNFFEYSLETSLGGDLAFITVTSSDKDVWCQSSKNVLDNNWHHVLGTYDGSKMKVYVDGVFEKECSQDGDLGNTDSSLYFGANYDDGSNLFGGLDDVAIWNRALSNSEVQELYDAQISTKSSFVPLSCRNPDSGIAGEPIKFTAEGGSGDYIWNNINENIVNIKGKEVSLSFSTIGFRKVELKSGTKVATCTIYISSINERTTGSAGSQTSSCSSCPAGQTCGIKPSGEATCVPFKIIEENGKKVAYPYESCLNEKPKFLDKNGNILDNKCFGLDGNAGTYDDCGCPENTRCIDQKLYDKLQSNKPTVGSCQAVCSDETPGGLPGTVSCSKKQPFQCNSNGELVPDADLCGCPSSLIKYNGKCLEITDHLSTNEYDFSKGVLYKTKIYRKGYENLFPSRIQGSPTAGGFICNSNIDGVAMMIGASLSNEILEGTTLPRYKAYCYIDEAKLTDNKNPYFYLDLEGNKIVDSMNIYFGRPGILDYQILVSQDGTKWDVAYEGTNNYDFPEKEYYRWNWGFGRYGKTATGYTTVYINKRTGVLEGETAEQINDGKNRKFGFIIKKINFLPIQARYIRINAVNWEVGTVLYGAEAYNSDSNIELSETLGSQGALYSACPSGNECYYNSPPIYTGANPDYITYKQLKWTQSSKEIYNHASVRSVKPSNFYLLDRGANTQYDGQTYSGSEFNDLAYRYYGMEGGPGPDPNVQNQRHYNSPSDGTAYSKKTYEYFTISGSTTRVFYNKNCISDGKGIMTKSSKSVVGSTNDEYCVAHPAFMPDGEFQRYSYVLPDVKDSAGNFNGKPFGAKLSTESKSGKSALFENGNRYISISDKNGELSLGTESTISFWMNLKDKSGLQRIFGKHDGLDANRKEASLAIWSNEGRLLFQMYDGNSCFSEHLCEDDLIYHFYSSKVFETNKWYHVAYSIYNGGVWLYVDGQRILDIRKNIGMDGHAGSDEPPRFNTKEFIIGSTVYGDYASNGISSTQGYKGLLDEVVIFNKALNDGEVSQVKTAQESNQEIPQAISERRLAHWKFNEEYWRKGYRTTYAMDLPSNNKIGRIEIEELIDRIYYIEVINGNDIISGISKNPNGNMNTKTVFDFNPTAFLGNRAWLYLWTYDYQDGKEQGAHSPLIWEITPYSAEDSTQNIPSNIKREVLLQFKSAKTKDGLDSTQWCGPSGKCDGSSYFKSSGGEDIGTLHDGNPWFKYRILMRDQGSIDYRYSPVIEDVSIGFTGGKNRELQTSFSVGRPSQGGSITPGKNVPFKAIEDNSIVSYEWSFGDGNVEKTELNEITHAYRNAGKYKVTLTVYDYYGRGASFSDIVYVEVFDCLAEEEYGNADPLLFPMKDTESKYSGLSSSELINNYVADAISKYANYKGIKPNEVDTAEEMYEAAAVYLYWYMEWSSDEDNKECVGKSDPNYKPTSITMPADFPQSLPIVTQFSGKCGCSKAFCGDCEDFSIMFTTLVRAMGVNSKCAYSSETTSSSGGHVANVVNYHSRFRVIEPQQWHVKRKFDSSSLDWTNSDGVPKYFFKNIFNDQIGKMESRDTTFQSIKERIVNNPGSGGISDSSNLCQKMEIWVGWNILPALKTEYLDNSWDPTTLYEDICPEYQERE